MNVPLFIHAFCQAFRRKVFISIPFFLFAFYTSAAIAQIHAPVTFSVMGDVPYDPVEEDILEDQIDAHNALSPSSFMVHVGDIKSGGDDCVEHFYSIMATRLHELDVPTYIVPGDNEYNDCNDPVQAWDYWEQYFTDFEEYWLDNPNTQHQNIRHENFAFLKDGVLFIGINLVGGYVHDQDEWNQRMQDDADWVDQQLSDNVSQVRAAVVFSQAGPDGPEPTTDRDLFFNQFVISGNTFGKPLLFVMGDLHEFGYDNPFGPGNMARLTVDNGGDEDPIQITITLDPQNPFHLVRDPFDDPNYYTILGTLVGDGGVDQRPEPTSLIEGTVVEVEAFPDPGWTFSHWSGDFSSTLNPGYFFMDEDKVISAHFTTVLPVELIDFEAAVKDCSTELKWSTGTERHSSHFQVQRSKDGYHFEDIHKVSAAGFSETLKNYQFIDEETIAGSNYYRLKQVDLDGEIIYSKVVIARVDCNQVHPDIFPNPASDELNIRLSSSSKEKYIRLIIRSSYGVILKKEQWEQEQSDNLWRIDLVDYPAGIYTIQLLIGDREIKTQKVMIFGGME